MPEKFNIRVITAKDLEKITELVERCRPYVASYNIYAYWILNNYFKTGSFVAVYGEKIIGFASALPSTERNTVFLWQICVDPDYRNHGVAQNLIDYIIEYATNNNFSKIEFSITESNTAGKNLFSTYAALRHMTVGIIRRENVGSSSEVLCHLSW